MAITPLLAWGWTGHGHLTALALGYALAQLVAMGKRSILETFARFAEEKTGHEPFGRYGVASDAKEESMVASVVKSATPTHTDPDALDDAARLASSRRERVKQFPSALVVRHSCGCV